MALGKGRRGNIPDSLSSEVIFLSQRRLGSLEGSGQTVDSSALQTHVHRKVPPKEPRPAGKSIQCTCFLTLLFRFGISMTTTNIKLNVFS